jgi:hypothetical protein
MRRTKRVLSDGRRSVKGEGGWGRIFEWGIFLERRPVGFVGLLTV